MLLNIYRFICLLVYPFIPIYLNIRASKDKEIKDRIRERYGFTKERKKSEKLIWFHAASIGESLSIMSLIKEIQKINDSQILITTGTKTSAEIVSNKIRGNIVHQFLPLDIPIYVNRFLNHWKPNIGILVESEIWPNLVLNSYKKNIKLFIINGRMAPKSFKKWSLIPKTSNKIFSCFEESLTQNNDSLIFYENLGVKKTSYTGNLKFTSSPAKLDNVTKIELEKQFKNRKVLIAASTHPGEEDMIVNITNEIRGTRRDFISVIIPRHPNRNIFIKNQGLESIVLRSKSKKIKKNTAVYLVDTLGELELFYSIADFVFIGGSFVNHGGQNPIEASYYGKIINHGPYIQNFTDVYSTLDDMKVTNYLENPIQLKQHIISNYEDPLKSSKKDRMHKIKSEGKNILEANMDILKKYLP